MARKAMILKQQAGNKFSTRRYNRCKICGRPHAYLRDYGVAVSASVSSPTKARSPASRRQAGNFSFPRVCANTHPCVIQMENRHQKSGEHGAACGSHSSDTLTS